MTVRIGTRGSRLALAQTALVADALRAQGVAAEIVVVHTRGDREADMPLAAIGRGAFTDILSDMIARGELDAAVHSAKDLPTEAGRDNFFCLPRADARDALVRREADEAVRRVGTGSLRRAAAVKTLLPQAEVLRVRGNVDTRLQKLRTGAFDALILAAAGLDRLGMDEKGLVVTRLSPEVCVPAACQGIIAVEGACGELIHDEETGRAAQIERTLQRLLGGGCTNGVGAYFDGETLFAQKDGVIHSLRYTGAESIRALAEAFA